MIPNIIVILKATYSYKYKGSFLKFVCLFNVLSSFFHFSVHIVVFLVKSLLEQKKQTNTNQKTNKQTIQ